MATVATISVNFAQYDSISFTSTGVLDRSINPRTLSQYCLGSSTADLSYLGGFVKKTGDTMSGYLTLPINNPTSDDHATRKGYVDSRINSLSATVNDSSTGGFVRIGGSIMTGNLVLNTSAPSIPLQASSKGYVDSRINSLSSTTDTKLAGEFLALNGGVMRGGINMNGSKIFGFPDNMVFSNGDLVTKKYVDSSVTTATTDAATNTYVNQQDALRVLKSGDTMSGRLAQSDKGFHSAVKDNITTRTDSGFYQTSIATKSKGWPADTNGWYHLFSNTHINDTNYYSMQFASQFDNSNELYYRSTNNNGSAAWNKIFHSGNTNTLSLIGYQPVNKAGDTMSGTLTLPNSDPTDNNHAARKKYVDDKVANSNSAAAAASSDASKRVLKTGDTMTGTLGIAGTTGTIGTATSYTGATIDVQASSTNIDSNAAYMTFHRPSQYAVKFGLDADNVLKVGGWSMGAVAHTIITSNNIKNFAPTSTEVNGKVAKTGDTMSGALTLPNSDPTDNNHAARKKYVDDKVANSNSAASAASSDASKRVLKTGDTMTGNLTINNGSPTLYLQDSDNRSAMIHCNSNILYFLRGDGTNSINWASYNNQWPLYINLENNDMACGGDVYSNGKILATKESVDVKVNRGGDTMSGRLTLTTNADLWGQNAALAITTSSDPGISFSNTSNGRSVNMIISNNAGAVLSVAGGYLGNVVHPILHAGNYAGYVNPDHFVKKTGGGGAEAMTGNLVINNGSPTIYLQDTNHRSAMIHVESNLFYILRGAANGTDWTNQTINGRWPLVVNLENGDVTAAGDVTAYSDERLKKNIKPIENALEKTLKLEGVSYEKIESDEKAIGLIAQKVKEVLPEVVKEDTKGFHTLNYGNMIGLLVEAIKELNAKVEKLEKKNI
jgi:hypothetical protein